MTLKERERLTNAGQVAELQEKDDRMTADARTTTSHSPSKPIEKPIGKPIEKVVTVTSADQLVVGMHVRLRDQGVSAVVEVVKVYPKNYKSLDESEPSCYLEGINNHSWTGLYFNEHLVQYQAAIVQI